MADNFDIKDFTTGVFCRIRATDIGSGVKVPHHHIRDVGEGNYETIAASQTDQVMGSTGAANDILLGILIVPANLNPGAVSIKDGGGSAITLFTGGTASVATLIPFFVPLNMKAGTAWKITTGANVSAIGIGSFT